MFSRQCICPDFVFISTHHHMTAIADLTACTHLLTHHINETSIPSLLYYTASEYQQKHQYGQILIAIFHSSHVPLGCGTIHDKYMMQL